ncbi:tol-pal system protein YbgF [Roseitranquillus sediminis]|uniref:tol-pal system protein YbgF n=1 Tax=Roseitranquillus sediminis TaxID=2809051 RepID=UPI001D0C9C43|nr:tol-pal system protein YbgF [Roseitranquillus sediminis]MBM9596420.1 tol-pal system protein YbgF [Roseitranquillus sediminis]
MRALALILALALPMPSVAQDASTLADIRQELSVLYVELQRLKRELSTTGAPGTAIGGVTTLERVDAIESQLTALTARTEEIQNRIDRVVTDGTNRIGDLEFRVCELEPGCDFGEIGETLPIGGEAPAGGLSSIVPATPQTGQVELAVGEQDAFDRARAAYDAGNYQEAARLFSEFSTTYTGGPLTAEAHYLRGQSLQRQGLTSEAARAYLDSFSGSPQSPHAPDALLQLGLALNQIGQQQEACVTLREVSTRFPQSPAASEAQAAVASLGCS